MPTLLKDNFDTPTLIDNFDNNDDMISIYQHHYGTFDHCATISYSWNFRPWYDHFPLMELLTLVRLKRFEKQRLTTG